MLYETIVCIKIIVVLIPTFIIVFRLLWILPSIRNISKQGSLQDLAHVPEVAVGSSIMILLGSGGHTGEMIRILDHVNLNSFNRIWISSSGDLTSILKAKDFQERKLAESKFGDKHVVIDRARNVGESIFSSFISTLLSFKSTIINFLHLPQLPAVLLLNGPGTSVPLAYILFALKFIGLCKTRIIYIESLARVNSLSVSGVLLLPISDRFIVQWKQLYYKYKRVEYYGILV